MPNQVSFVNRHNGPTADDISQMLELLSEENLDALIDESIPQAIRYRQHLQLPPAQSEYAALAQLQAIASKNCCNTVPRFKWL